MSTNIHDEVAYLLRILETRDSGHYHRHHTDSDVVQRARVKEITGIDAFLAYQDHRYGSGPGYCLASTQADLEGFDGLMSNGGDTPTLFTFGIDRDRFIPIVLGLDHNVLSPDRRANALRRLLTKWHSAPAGVRSSAAEAFEFIDCRYRTDWAPHFEEMMQSRVDHAELRLDTPKAKRPVARSQGSRI